MARIAPVLCLLAALAAAWPAGAMEIHKTPDAFIDEAFAGGPPKPGVIWMSGDLAARVERLLGHPYGALRVRYWRQGERTAWVLDEIGKHEPITAGIVVEDGRIERVEILIYREGRGGEVHQPFFRKQFAGAALDRDSGLDRPIDGISGATLSVRAVAVMARLALMLHGHLDGGR